MKKRVAVVGFSFRLPGTTRDRYWSDLLEGKDLVNKVDLGRWAQEAYLHPRKSEPGTSYTFSAGSIGDIAEFDAGFFGISPREASQMDPQQRLLLELTWESLENAGIKPSAIRGSQCGVYLGIATTDYAYYFAGDLAAIDSSVATGNTASIAANRISYLFDLHGPSMALDTACSSSLVAFHQACQSILTGECTEAITGGVSLNLHPYGFIAFSKASMLSRRGKCNVFDVSSDGYVRSEGGGIFFLKDYDQALADGNQILAIVAKSAVNTDGKKPGLTVPSSQSQADLLRHAYTQAGINPSSIDYIEAHGTGTAVGDPIEAGALGEALGKRRSKKNPLLIGSVKSNMGHLEAAAGVAGMVKALYCIQHRSVPATIHLKTPNPKIHFDDWNLKVVTENTPLKKSGRLIIGINSFGFGGANAHVIIESPARQVENTPAKPNTELVPLILSGKSRAALKVAAQQYSIFLGHQKKNDLYDIAYSAAFHRDWHEHRAVIFGSSPKSLAKALGQFADGLSPELQVESGTSLQAPSRPAFIYAGNGSQWQGMGQCLMDKDPTFRVAVQEVDELFKQYANFSIADELAGKNGAGRFELTEIAQPALFAMQVGITRMLRQRGIVPAVVAGHSVGEIAAAWASGALSLSQAVKVLYYRSKLQGTTKGKAQMTAVGLGDEAVLQLLDSLGLTSSLTLAGVNSPRAVTIAGETSQLALLEATLAKRKVFYKRLDLDYAFHSPAMDPIADKIQEELSDLQRENASISFYSTVTGGLLAGTDLDGTYWWRNIRQPVQFERAIKAIQSSGINIFVEVGPHAVLQSYINDCLKDEGKEGRVISTLVRGDGHPDRVWSAVSQIMIAGVPSEWETFFPKRGKFVQLPNYPWQRERYWHTVTSESYGFRTRNKEHPYLGYRLRESEWTWENHIDTQLYPTLGDHVVGEAIVFPGTGYVEMALAAAQLWHPGQLAEVEELEIRSPLLLSDSLSKTVRFNLDPTDGSFSICSRARLSDDPWILNVVGRLLREPQSVLLDRPCPTLPGCPPSFDSTSHLALTTSIGLRYGPAFQAIREGWVKGQTVIANLQIPDAIVSELDKFHLHPALLDCAFQLLFNVLRHELDLEGRTAFVPVKLGRLIFRTGKTKPTVAWAHLIRRGPRSLTADFVLFDENGLAVAWVKEARFRSIRLHKDPADRLRYLGEYYIPKPHPLSPNPGAPLALEELSGTLCKSLHKVPLQKAHRLYTEEIEPLLDALCSSFAAQALKTLFGGETDITREFIQAQIEKVPEVAALLMRLLGMMEEDQLLRATETGWRYLANDSRPSPQQIWNSLVADYPDYFSMFHAVGCVGLHLESILAGRQTAKAVYPRECTLAALSHHTLGIDGIQSIGNGIIAVTRQWLGQLPESRRLRIIELSRGQPSYAAQILPVIESSRCDYTVATPSQDAMEHFRPLQEHFPCLEVQQIDLDAVQITKNIPNDERFDLAIVTSEFATDIATLQALAYVKRMLCHGGTVILIEQHPSRWTDFVFGAQASWWVAAAAGTWESRHGGAKRWQHELKQMGFGGVTQLELSPGVNVGPYLLLAQVAATEQTLLEAVPPPARNWVMLADADGYSEQLSRLLSKQLETNGDHIICVSPGGELQALNKKHYRLDPRNTAHIGALLQQAGASFGRIDGILHLYGLNRSLADKDPNAMLAQQVDRCAVAAAMIQACESTNTTATCWLLTARTSKALLPGHQQKPQVFYIEDTIDAPLRGFSRTLMTEVSNFAIRLIDLVEPEGIEDMVNALERELRYPDTEIEITLTANGERFVPRLRVEAQADGQVMLASNKTSSSTVRLGFQLPGQLRNLHWESHPRVSPVEDEIEIDVHATGLNFRDVMYALGMLSDEAVENGFAGPTLGLELSGVVASVGARVEGFAPGDKVVAYGPACFGNRVITKATAMVLKPPGISFEAAATIPCAFLTAYYALHHLACLQEGEKILIHGAAGGVGIAAIQIAKWRGAEIFASAGSKEKRDFLKLLGADHILDSRTLVFADEILALTEGKGVDVVLNSLAGEAINRNLQILKPFGRFLELGKRDFYENTKIGVRPFRNNISYFGIDTDQLMQASPDLTQKLFREIMALFNDGVLHPLPYHAFDAAEIVDAFRYMQQSRHIGKIIVTYQKGIVAQQSSRQTKRKLELPATATYLVTGGLSGFGLKTAQWLAGRGARHLVLISRRGPVAPEALVAIAALQAQGVKVHAVSCDVTDKEALSALLQEIQATMPPLRGVIHAAMVIADGLIRNMNRDQIRQVLAPKILGAQYLHQLTSGLELDFFVLFSSATTLFGNPGQGNYVAANTYLEALAQSRRAAGLPALCVRWGPIGDVGFLARNEQVKEALQSRMGGAALISDVALDALESLLVEDRSGRAVLELDWNTLSRSLPTAHTPRFGELSRNAKSSDTEDEDTENIQRLLAELGKEELAAVFIEMLKTEVGEILRISPEKIDENRSIYDLGLDSLMGVELVTAIDARYGVTLPTFVLSESPTIAKLAEKIIAQLTSDDGNVETDRAAEMRSTVQQVASQHAADVTKETVDQVAHAIQTSELARTSKMIH